jgi:uncharacterized protein (DUF302 family)
MRGLFVALIAVGLTLGLPGSVRAENPTPYSGTVTTETGKPFPAFAAALEASVKANGFNLIAIACADCGIKAALGETVPGNRVFLFFKPAYAKRVLTALPAAGIEAPIRVYVTEASDGTASVTYRLPSHVFGAYEVPALSDLGRELDEQVSKILADAAAGS